MIKDAQGHDVSGATAEAADYYDLAMVAYHSGFGDAMGLLDEAQARSPGFAMVYAVKAWMFSIANDPMFRGKALEMTQTAAAHARNEREKTHVAALELSNAGESTACAALLDRHLMRYPLDLVAHQAALILNAYQGRFPSARDRSARALPFWSKDQPGYATILSFHAMGLEESADYARAEEESRIAAELDPHAFWPHHIVAHVMEMTGRPQDGLGWMSAREPLWSAPENVTRIHIWWHRALFHVELGQYDAALALHDGPISESLRPMALNLCNPTALLWRLDTLGHDVGSRWAEEAKRWEGHADGRSLLFADLHAAMAELRSGQEALAEKRLAAMRETAAGTGEKATIYRELGLPMVEAVTAFHREDYARAAELLLPVRYEVWRMGGSHAQRDIVDWTLTVAAIKGGLKDVALGLTHERLGLRPRSAVNRAFLRQAERIAA